MGSVDIPKALQINFTGLEHRSDIERAEVRLQVMRALEEFGCFEVVCDDKLTPELREAFFGKAIKEPFGLPLETKLASSPSDRPYQGYIPKIPGRDYESLVIPDDAESLHNFTKLMWGEEGNPSFRETLSKFLRAMKEIDDMVVKMVHESYGVEKHLDSHLKTNEHSLRLSHYGAPPKPQEVVEVIGRHTDTSMTTIVCQHEQEGLEIQLKDGSWATPSRNSINFLLGEYMLAWSNGRLHPTYHRVKMTGSVDRYSTVYASAPGDETQVETLKELVDSDHPLLFKPFYIQEYLGFRFTEAGMKVKCPLQAFCGITTVDQPAAATTVDQPAAATTVDQPAAATNAFYGTTTVDQPAATTNAFCSTTVDQPAAATDAETATAG